MMIKKITLLFLIIVLNNCNHRNVKNEVILHEKKSNESEVVNEKKNDTIKEQLSLDFLQGIWSGNTNLNQSKPFRIVFNNKVLDVVCIEGVCDGSEDFTSFWVSGIGFIDKINKKAPLLTKLKNSYLKKKGKFLIIYNLEKDNETIKKIRFDSKYKILENTKIIKIYNTSLCSSYLYNEEIYNRTDFVKIAFLSKNQFKILKIQSKKDQRDYIKEFNIKGFSSKIKVTADKTYFYNDKELKEKRKAFLVKGDIAYLENVGIDNVQVYFDGKVVTGGYLKKDDVQILE